MAVWRIRCGCPLAAGLHYNPVSHPERTLVRVTSEMIPKPGLDYWLDLRSQFFIGIAAPMDSMIDSKRSIQWLAPAIGQHHARLLRHQHARYIIRMTFETAGCLPMPALVDVEEERPKVTTEPIVTDHQLCHLTTGRNPLVIEDDGLASKGWAKRSFRDGFHQVSREAAIPGKKSTTYAKPLRSTPSRLRAGTNSIRPEASSLPPGARRLAGRGAEHVTPGLLAGGQFHHCRGHAIR